MNVFQAKAVSIEEASGYGLAWRRNQPLVSTPWFTYNHVMTVTTGTAGATSRLKTRPDGDFVCTAIAAYPGFNGYSDMTIQVIDLSTDKPWFNRPMQIWNVFGSQSQALNLPAPRLIPARTDLQFIIVQHSGADRDVYIALKGKRVFYGGAS